MPFKRFEGDQEPIDNWLVLDNNDPVEDPVLRQRAVGNRRCVLIEVLENEGRGRPYHAMGNTRE